MDDRLRSDHGSGDAADQHVGNGARPERFARRVGGGEAELLHKGRRHSGHERPHAEKREAAEDHRRRLDQRADGTHAHAQDEAGTPADAGHEECGGNRAAGGAEDEGRHRQRRKRFVVAKQHAAGERTACDVDRRQRAGERARQREHQHIAPGFAIVARCGHGGIAHAGLSVLRPCTYARRPSVIARPSWSTCGGAAPTTSRPTRASATPAASAAAPKASTFFSGRAARIS